MNDRSPSARFLPRFVALAGVCLAAAGCRDSRDPNVYWISGTVTFDGAAITAGSMIFEPADPKFGAVGCDITNGTFRTRVPKGEHAVRILANREVPLTPGTRVPQEPGMPPPKMDVFQYLPECYNRSTELKVEVKKSGDTFTFSLDSRPAPNK